MKTKHASNRAGSKPAKGTAAAAANPSPGPDVTIRMYRQGLGDCFLIRLPSAGGKDYFILIDCGVILGTPNANSVMQGVVKDILTTTGGRLDLLVATHEHWDHLSGFCQAKDLFAQLKGKVDQVWLAWTENPNDPLAKQLRAEHTALRVALTSAAARLRLAGADTSTTDSLLEFFGAAGQGTTGDALEIVKGLCDPKNLRFCLPSDAPVKPDGVEASIYVLGPPHDEAMIKKVNPSGKSPETYELAGRCMTQLTDALTNEDLLGPCDPTFCIPFDAASQMQFFRTRYWGENPDPDGERDQSWRRIDGDWLDAASTLALQLDSATNNTSLVLAIELAGGEVLLFAADAQVGNWLSWQTLKWKVNGQDVSGPDLLRRTVFYKVGHHGSHNATLRQKGLEMMEGLKFAMIPVDHQMALKKRWGNMPLDAIVETLGQKTGGCVLRVDQPVPPALAGVVTDKGLYYELRMKSATWRTRGT